MTVTVLPPKGKKEPTLPPKKLLAKYLWVYPYEEDRRGEDG